MSAVDIQDVAKIFQHKNCNFSKCMNIFVPALAPLLIRFLSTNPVFHAIFIYLTCAVITVIETPRTNFATEQTL